MKKFLPRKRQIFQLVLKSLVLKIFIFYENRDRYKKILHWKESQSKKLLVHLLCISHARVNKKKKKSWKICFPITSPFVFELLLEVSLKIHREKLDQREELAIRAQTKQLSASNNKAVDANINKSTWDPNRYPSIYAYMQNLPAFHWHYSTETSVERCENSRYCEIDIDIHSHVSIYYIPFYLTTRLTAIITLEIRSSSLISQR